MFRRRRQRQKEAAEAAAGRTEAERQIRAFSVGEEDETRAEEARLAEEAWSSFQRRSGHGVDGTVGVASGGGRSGQLKPRNGGMGGGGGAASVRGGGGGGGGSGHASPYAFLHDDSSAAAPAAAPADRTTTTSIRSDERPSPNIGSVEEGEGGNNSDRHEYSGQEHAKSPFSSFDSGTSGRTTSFRSHESSVSEDGGGFLNLPEELETRLEKGDHVYRRSKGGLAQVHGIVISCAPDDDGPLVIADFTGRGYERAVSKGDMRKMKEEVERERRAEEEACVAAREAKKGVKEVAEKVDAEMLPWGGRGCAVAELEKDWVNRGGKEAPGGNGDGAKSNDNAQARENIFSKGSESKEVSGGHGHGDVAHESDGIEGDIDAPKVGTMAAEGETPGATSYDRQSSCDDGDADLDLLGPADKLDASEHQDLTQSDDDGTDNDHCGLQVDDDNSRIRIVAISGKKNIRRWKKVSYGGTSRGGWFRRRKKQPSQQSDLDAFGGIGISSSTTHRKKTKDEQLPGSDPSALVVSRVMFLYEQQHLLPPRHALLSNSECISVWCKTGRWSTFQVSAYLHTTWGSQSKMAFTLGAFASSQTVTVPAAGYMGWLGYTTAVPLLAAHPLILPAIAGYGVVSIGVPIWMLRKCGRKWDKTTMMLNETFWENAGNEVFVECVRHWSGLDG